MQPSTSEATNIAGVTLPKTVAALGLVLGLCHAFVTPPLRVPDETSHFFRAFAASRASCIGPPAIMSTVDWREMNAKHVWITLPDTTTPQQMAGYMRPPHNLDYGSTGAFAVGNMYNCLPYVPGGIGIAAARLLGGTPIGLMYAGRVTTLLAYVGLMYFAMKLSPPLQAPLAAVTLMPMALNLAGSLSADSIAIALSCLFVSFVIKHAFGGHDSPFTRSERLGLVALIVSLALSKALLVFSGLLLLLPVSKFGSRTRKWVSIALLAAIGVSTSLAWHWSNRANADRVTAIRAEYGIDMAANGKYILANPADFMRKVVHTAETMAYEYLEEYVGKLGWLDVQLPAWLTWTYLATLLFTALGIRGLTGFGLQPRLLLASIALVNVLTVFAVIWTFETHTSRISPGAAVIHGVQGRYLIPSTLPLLAAVSGRWISVSLRRTALIVVCIGVAANGVAIRAVGKTFHSEAPLIADGVPILPGLLSAAFWEQVNYSKYEGQLVRRPGVEPEDQKVYFVSKGKKRWVVNGGWIAANGYEWPGDVLVIPREDLDAIMLGTPIIGTK